MVYHISQIFAFFTLISDIFIILFLGLGLYQKFNKNKYRLYSNINIYLKEKYLLFAFVISLAAMLGSLYYSEILGYNPCKLCWLQRIFIYPQTFLFGVALIIKDRKIAIYSIVLSFFGGLIASFHYWLQISNTLSFSCDVIGNSSSCTEKFFLQFGYITIPVMALTVFILLIILGFYSFERKVSL